MKGKAEFNQQILWGFVVENYIFSSLETKKSSVSKKFRYRFKRFFFSLLLKDGLKSNQ